MTESGQPNRDEKLEHIVDQLHDDVADEREDKDVPGKPSDREDAETKGSAEEPTA